MPSTSLQIVVPEMFAADLARRLPASQKLRVLKEQSDTETAALLADADVLVSGAFKASWRAPGQSRLRLVHAVGAGIDGIDASGLPSGCEVCNVYGHERGVAEQAFMLMLALHKRLLPLDSALRRGNWTPQRPYLPELRDRNLLVLGLGHIGRELVRWGRFLDMKVTVLTRRPEPERAAKLGIVALDGLENLAQYLPAADFIVIAIPAASGTVGMIGRNQLALMKPDAFLVNVGRGPVVDEDGLFDALVENRIAGAGLDVWWQYPALGGEGMPSRRPFGELDNVVMTPHKPTLETMEYRWREIAANLERFAKGEPLERVVLRT